METTPIYDEMLRAQHIGQALMREAEGFKYNIASESERLADIVRYLGTSVKDGNWSAVDSYVHTLIQQANQLRRFTAFVASTSYYEPKH